MLLEIPERYEGPPGSVNGGIASGLLSAPIKRSPRATEVTLRKPVPFTCRLELGRKDTRLRDLDRTVVAEARRLDRGERRELDALASRAARVGLDAARAARAASPLAGRQPFPRCFACGPARDDGLRLLAGPVEGTEGVWAVDWTPDEAAPLHVWAALDCPSSAPIASPTGDPPYVLGRIAARVPEGVAVGEPHVVVAWELGREGRKAFSASVLLGPDGEPRAVARATWIALRG